MKDKKYSTLADLLCQTVLCDSGCLLWTGPMKGNYGSVGRGYAHRLVYSLTTGKDIPRGLEVMHECDTPLCIRFEHLRLGTHRENMQDMRDKNRHAHGETLGKFTDAQARAVFDMYAAGTLQREIAEKLGVSHAAVCLLLRGKTWSHLSGVDTKLPKLNFRGVDHARARFTVEEILTIRRKAAQGVAFNELAKEFGTKHSTIRAIYLRSTWGHIPEELGIALLRAPARVRNKFTPEQILAMRRLAAAGTTHKAIALQFNTGINNVGRIVRRDVWKHI